jgi:hypothetical protein
MTSLKRIAVWLCLLLITLGVQAQPPLPTPTMTPIHVPDATPGTVINLPGATIDDSTTLDIPPWLQLVLAVAGGAAGLRQLFLLFVKDRAEAQAHRRKLESTQVEGEREERRAQTGQIDALLTLVGRSIEQQTRSYEQQAQWLTAIQGFTTAIGENNIRSAEERRGITIRQEQILETLAKLVTATQDHAALSLQRVQETATMNVLLKAMMNMLARGDATTWETVKAELRGTGEDVMTLLNTMTVAEMKAQSKDEDEDETEGGGG